MGDHWLEVIAVVVSIVAIFISVIAWRKSRAIYDVERKLFFRKPEKDGPNNNNDLKNKLKSGKYTTKPDFY